MFLTYLSDLLTGKRNTHTLKIVIIYALIASILPIYNLFTKTYPLVKKLPTFSRDLVDELYPADLEIKIENGKASANVTEPYYVTIKVSRLREILESFSPSYGRDLPKVSSIRLLTIDTKASIESYHEHQSLFLLTRENIVYQDNGEVKFRSLSGVSNTTITKEYISGKLEELLKNPVWDFVMKYGVYLGILIIPIFAAVYYLITALFFALVIYLISRIMQTGISYKLIFNWVVFVSFPMLIILLLVSNFGRVPQFAGIALDHIYTIITLIFAYLILLPLKGSIFKK